jgi:FlaA1/EpsC-like NDP-sugar epimerase
VENKQTRVLIVGAGSAGNRVFHALNENKEGRQGWTPVGFIDDDYRKIGSKVCGIPVWGNRFAIPAVVAKQRINVIILALPSAPPREICKIIEICNQTRARVKILPGTYDLVTGRLKPAPIRDVQLSDLLGREPLTLDTKEIYKYINDQVVLITGAGGSVGTELSYHVANSNPRKLILVGRGENSIYEVEQILKLSNLHENIVTEIADIKDRGRVARLFKKYRPHVIFHAAAHKHVPYMERIPEEAVKNNIIGTKVLCDVAFETGCEKFILISTDKAVKPSSIMGATKKVAEMIVVMMNSLGSTKFAAVRFGNILGSRGSVIPLFERQISMGGPVTITHPQMTRYFMTVDEAAQLVIQAGALAKGGEIFVLDMGEPICIKDLAYKLIRMKGLEPEKDIPIVYTGIRPGEKIREMLVEDDEQVSPTRHNKIFVINKKKTTFDDLKQLLVRLENPDFSYADDEIREMLSNFLCNTSNCKNIIYRKQESEG